MHDAGNSTWVGVSGGVGWNVRKDISLCLHSGHPVQSMLWWATVRQKQADNQQLKIINNNINVQHTTKHPTDNLSNKYNKWSWNVQSCGANVHPHLIHTFPLGPPESTPHPKRHLHRFSVFAQLWQSVPILYNGPPLFPFKIASSHGGSGPPSNTWFLGPIQVHNPNGISVGSAVFHGSRPWQTDRRATIGHTYVVLQCGLMIYAKILCNQTLQS